MLYDMILYDTIQYKTVLLERTMRRDLGGFYGDFKGARKQALKRSKSKGAWVENNMS